jgi:hypothetical protein
MASCHRRFVMWVREPFQAAECSALSQVPFGRAEAHLLRFQVRDYDDVVVDERSGFVGAADAGEHRAALVAEVRAIHKCHDN